MMLTSTQNGHAPSMNGHAPALNGDVKATNGQTPLVEAVQMNLPWADLLPLPKESTEKAEPVAKRAARYHETGHAINVQNFDLLKQIIIGFGAEYVSSNPMYALPNLELLYTEASSSVDTVINRLTSNQETIDVQTATFLNLKKDATRSKNMFAVCGVPPEAIKRCKHINSLIQGARIKPIKADDEDQKHISASHQSHTQQVEHVDAFIELFDTYPQYTPPAELTAAAWTTKRDAMKSAMQAVTVSSVDLKMARMNRNFTLYKPGTGLVDVALGVKKVVLGIFGATSPQYRMVSGIEFTKIKGYKNL
jgi:hypothetical protein